MPDTDGWVGSWRPHRPRGPIAALYSSPGPKYALPGLTGINKHDPSKFKAPEYSFGVRHGQLNAESSPGPRYLVPYNITRVGRDGTPAFSLYSRTKELGLFKGPGPGQYSPEGAGRSVFFSAPAYTLSGRSKEFQTNITPGPAAYMLPAVLGPKIVATAAAPTYSLCGRSKVGSFHEDLKKTPGPGAYKLVEPGIYKKKAPQYSITGRNVLPAENFKKPGPGDHHPEQVTFTKAKAPSFSFGIRHSQYVAPLIVNVTEE